MLHNIDQVRNTAQARYCRNHRQWLWDASCFPLSLPIAGPTKEQFLSEPGAVIAWRDAWAGWSGAGQVMWSPVKWSCGAQSLPARVVFTDVEQLTEFCGQLRHWNTLRHRVTHLSTMCALNLAQVATFSKELAELDESNWISLLACLEYLIKTPQSNLYLRQLPIPGVHTKWLKANQVLVAGLMSLTKGTQKMGFHEACGIRKAPIRRRVMILDQALRSQVGGLRDLELPLDDLAAWALRPAKVLVLENLETLLALPDLADTIAVCGMGNSAGLLTACPWLTQSDVLYWGDIDTHGLAIYHRFATQVPHARAVLMDLVTLQTHQALWVHEPAQHGRVYGLPPALQATFDYLYDDPLGQGCRLEQERIPLDYALAVLHTALDRA